MPVDIEEHISAAALAAGIRRGTWTAREVAEHFLARVDALDPALNSIVWRDDEATLQAADRIDAEGPRGLFAGVPLTIKDTFAVEGQPHTLGSHARDLTPAPQSDLLVQAAQKAGFVQLGRAATPELAMTTSCESERYGITRNPWNVERSPGGSSGGSAAAVAAGLVPVALGSDGGGSIRLPAAFCGVVGLKPTRGLLPQRIAGWEGGSTEGFLTRTIADTAAVYEAMAQQRDEFAWSLAPEPEGFTQGLAARPDPLRIGLITTAFDPGIPVDAACAEAATDVARTLQQAGHEIVELNPIAAMAEVMDIYPRTIIPAWLTQTPLDHPERLQAYIRRTIERGRQIDAGTYLAEARRFKLLAREISQYLFGDLDLIVTPTAATRVPGIGVVWNELREKAPSRDCQVYEQCLAFTTVPSVIGSPAISLPTHVDADGLPVGVQLIGRQFSETLLLQTGQLLEQAYAWPTRKP
ncbi:amidase [Kineosporia babensis]|uniref:Amidase n=1 Tax=Kineosporia babensis TaxID=499548 RepID=A0A9X1NEX9_9ACTN|nr:amidase [Kineosporia babensis]